MDSKAFLKILGRMVASLQDLLRHANTVPPKDGSQSSYERVCEVLLQEICLSYQDSPLGTQKLQELFNTWVDKVLTGASTSNLPDLTSRSDDRYQFTAEPWKSTDEYYSRCEERPSMRALFYTPTLQVAEDIKNSLEWKTLTSIDDDKGAAMVQDIVVCRWMNNCLFTTKSGLLGLASVALEVGDQVVLFSGFLLPIIVRPEGSCYRFISAAYVEGLMLGEEWPEDQGKLQEFTIC